ncbi:MAG: type IV pilus modification protein PilV [Candidatus Competibacteraceae bacterium]|nr:MAG: type IV pilus modification protein PilV [Candidatus Competibacteraceae bacterium]
MNKGFSNFQRFHHDGGFTLLEVLVATVVLSVGLLSLAGLQVIGLRTGHSSYLRTQATIQSYDIIDRMRANKNGVGDYNQPTQAGSAGTEDTNCETVNGCSTASMAAHDLFRWNQAIVDVLPGGVGVVCVDSTPEDGDLTDPACDNVGGGNPATATYAIKIWWTDDQAAGTQQLFATSFRP